jgi:hypothetical protein
LDIADGEPRRILARLVDPANPREWVLNVLGISAEERESHHFLWDLGDATRLTGALVRHTFARAGLYSVTLQATDPANRPAYVLSQVVAVGVDGSSADFLVSFEARVDYGVAPPTIWAKAATTTLESGETVGFEWSMSDGATAAGPELNHVLTGTEPLRVSVTATTSLGRTASYFRYFSPTGDDLYDPAGGDLVADAGADQTVAPGDTVTLDGSGSTYSGQAPVTFLWTQIAGPAVTLERNDRPLVRFTAPEADSGPITLEFRLTLTSQDQSAFDTVTITVAPTMALAGTPFYGMEVVSVLPEGDGVTVTTSGGVYEVKPGGIDAWRRIAPATNSVNPRKVATLTFAPSVGVFSVESADRRSCVLKSAGGLRVQINSDSLVFLENTGASLTYTYTSLLPNPPWAKGVNGDFYYNDGDGGTCHYMHPDTPGTYGGGAGVPNTFPITLATGRSSAFGVFPPKAFDFEKLYGEDARPFVAHLYNPEGIRTGGSTWQIIDRYKQRRFGVLSFFNFNYYADSTSTLPPGVTDPFPGVRYKPVFNEANGRWEYHFEEPEYVRPFTDFAHSHGLRVTTYFYPYEWEEVTGTTLMDALSWMREFQLEHGLDGWYLDGLGSATKPNWLRTYDFMRQLREDVGDSGHLFLHTSLSPWGRWDGRVLIHAEAYGSMTLKGETGELAVTHSPNDLVFRYYTGGYGNSQALGAHFPKRSGFARGSLRTEERSRLMGSIIASERIAGVSWSIFDEWLRPAYEENRRRYAEGNLAPLSLWPVSWYNDIPVAVSVIGPEDAVVVFSTPEFSLADVRYLQEQPDYGYSFDDAVWSADANQTVTPPIFRTTTSVPQTSFSLPLTGLKRSTTYYVRVRCSAALSPGEFEPAAERIYGGFAAFTTPAD